MSTRSRNNKHFEAFKNTVVSVVSSLRLMGSNTH